MKLAQDFMAIVLISVVLVLLLKQPSATQTVIQSLGSGIDNTINVLQGNGTGGLGSLGGNNFGSSIPGLNGG